MKQFIKDLIKRLPIAFTKNQQYDALTEKIFKKYLSENANCIDIGCHKGEVLDLMIKYAPQGRHIGFEPLPDFYQKLTENYSSIYTFFNVALSDSKGIATFNYVISNPAYSGLQKRKYDKPNEEDTTIEVQMDKLDHLINENQKVDLIKIDVEGGEMGVLKGATNLLQHQKPILIFEHGKGAADIYGTEPSALFDFLTTYQYEIYTLKNFLKDTTPITKAAFVEHFEKGTEYYFAAK